MLHKLLPVVLGALLIVPLPIVVHLYDATLLRDNIMVLERQVQELQKNQRAP